MNDFKVKFGTGKTLAGGVGGNKPVGVEDKEFRKRDRTERMLQRRGKKEKAF